MPELDLTPYRATYDPEAWARVIEQYPTTDARVQLLVPACLAIRALCDEVERLRAHAEAQPPPAVVALAAERDRLRKALEDVRAIAADRERFVLLGPRSFAQALAIIDSAVGTPAKPPKPQAFGGRYDGQRCGCGGTLHITWHDGVAAPCAYTLDCGRCEASYDEAGAHWCPGCETWPSHWTGGTDADPRPWCSKCGAPQPGWPDEAATRAAKENP